MISVLDLAQYVIDFIELEDENNEMTSHRLQAICHYANFWYILWEGKPLVKEKCYKTDNGFYFKELKEIAEEKFFVNNILFGKSSNIKGKKQKHINAICDMYKNFLPYELKNMMLADDLWKYLAPDEEATVEDVKIIYGDFMREKETKLKRSIKFFNQRIVHGFDDSETWNLDYEFFRWIYPRLARFRKVNIGFPANMTEDEWNKELDKQVRILKLINDSTENKTIIKEEDIDIDDFKEWYNKKEYAKSYEDIKKELHEYNYTGSMLSDFYCNYLKSKFLYWFAENNYSLWW